MIRPGDTVMVAYPARCCGYLGNGAVFVVDEIYPAGDCVCSHCGDLSIQRAAGTGQYDFDGLEWGCPVYRLVKLFGPETPQYNEIEARLEELWRRQGRMTV